MGAFWNCCLFLRGSSSSLEELCRSEKISSHFWNLHDPNETVLEVNAIIGINYVISPTAGIKIDRWICKTFTSLDK